MTVSNNTPRNQYIGNGSTDIYNYTFKIFNKNHLLVTVRDDENVEEVLDVDADFTVDGIGLPTGGQITLLAGDLPLNYVLVIRYNAPVNQDTVIRNQKNYYPAVLEDTYDKIVKVQQQQQTIIDGSLKIAETDNPSNIDMSLPPGIENFAEYVPILNKDAITGKANGWSFKHKDSFGGGASGATLAIGTPTDTILYNGPMKITPLTLLADAMQISDNLFKKLVPASPDNLVDKVLTIVGSYLALRASTGISDICTDDVTPVIQVGGYTLTITDGFADADAGTLSAEVDAVEVGSVNLDSNDDSGTYGELQIVDFDPYAGQGLGKEGLVTALIARINSAVLAVGEHLASLIHTTTGQADLTFFIDDPITPSIAGGGTLTPSGTTAYKSGVPAYVTGATLTAAFTVNDAVKTHYNPTRIARATSAVTNTVDAALPGSPPANGASVAASIGLTVATNQYTETASATATGYNSKGNTGTANITSSIRVDSVGTETRVTSSTGQYPAAGYGSAYVSTDSLATNKELQFLNGKYQYPPLVSYTAKLPAGPDYTGLTTDAYASMRWATFNLGAVSAVTSKTIAFTGATNFGATTLISGMIIQLRVDGASPTTGWVDANAAYPGVGNPTANGDAALDIGGSTVTSKRVTFGASVKTGTVYVRVGIPSGSTKSFSGVS